MSAAIRFIALVLAAAIVLGTMPQAAQKGKQRSRQHSAPERDSLGRRTVQADYGSYSLTLRTLDGRPARLSDYAGRVLLVNLWAPWCAPCRVETPGFRELYDRFHAAGFDILGVAVQTNESDVRSFMQRYGVLWPVGLDDDVARAWGTYGLPDSYLFAWDGALIKHFIGYTRKEVLSPYLEDALKQRAAAIGR